MSDWMSCPGCGGPIDCDAVYTCPTASGAAGPPSDEACNWCGHRIGTGVGCERCTEHEMDRLRAALASAEQRARTQPAADAHPEDYCHRCGGPNVSWAAPSPLWNAVMRGGDINGRDLFNGIVCPLCFAVLAEAAGIASQWRLSAENVNQPLQTITPSGRVWDDNAWLWREPE
jgi:hypothetical protein